jgi:predicted nucleic acid-binding Zn ribbon protein
LKTCQNCGTELKEEAKFCRECGASLTPETRQNVPTQQLIIPKNVVYVVMVALALMGLAVVGLAVRGPTVITQTNYVTQMQPTTYTASFTSTETQAYTVTMASFATMPAGPPPSWFTAQYCGYPFNPYLCNEGPPVTITGYLTNDTTCVDLYVSQGQTYVVWNLPNTEPAGAYQVYGFVYPNWPQTQPFPPYPFQKTLCIGTPMWAVPPYIQSAA